MGTGVNSTACKRSARASGIFIGTITTVPIKRQVAAAPIRGPGAASCRPLAASNSGIKGVGSYPSIQQGRTYDQLINYAKAKLYMITEPMVTHFRYIWIVHVWYGNIHPCRNIKI
jgi:hypothetical protein